MRKNKLTAILLCLSLAGIANAQEKSPQVIKSEPQLEDIYNVLEAMDTHIFRFDLKEFLNKTYSVNVYVDEYEKGKSPKQAHSIRLGNNIQSLNVVPEEHRQAFREIKHIPEGKNEWEEIKELAVYLRKSNYNRENETCNFQKRNEQNFSFFASFFLLLFRPLKHQLNAD
ncbi:DUF5041 domain-containing protein [Bacteroides acidifaciens]|uniref:DUF5041 domain-containing protein n=1 Tax=Bacteroides acidifaciens TaxID=85831 RepID=UPI0030157878